MKRRTFNAEFKAKIVLEVLRGEKELNVIAAENEIAPNQIRNWKAEFLKNAVAAFDDKRTEELKADLKDKEHETDDLYKKAGQLTTQVDWLKKQGLPIGRPKTRRYMREMGISVIYQKPNLSNYTMDLFI